MKVLALILVAFLSQQTHPGATSTLRGVIFKTGTTTPVDKAIVELRPEKDAEPRVATTGSNGRFEFLNVPSGPYQLNASRNGYLNTSFGQRGASGSSRTLKIEPGATVDNLELFMTATGAIAGRVFDDTGEPLANVSVEALKYSYVNGERSLTPVGSDTTNDLGEFRLFWLPPGQYYLRAVPENSVGDKMFTIMKVKDSVLMSGTVEFSANSFSLGKLASGPNTGRALVPVYYPGTADPQLASAIDVRSGADVRGIDFRLTHVITRKVRGTAIDSVTGQPSSSGDVTLVPRGDFGGDLSSSISPTGMFEFNGVRPGSYLLVANALIDDEGKQERVRSGTTRVEVGESDLNSIVVTLQRSVTIEAAITVDGPATIPPDVYPELTLTGTQHHSSTTSEYDDGINTQFRFSNVREGEYRIGWESSDALPPGVYLKSASFGPVDALNGSIQVDQRTRDRLQIVFGTNAGVVMGTVVNRERKPAPGVKVVLVPDTHRQRNDLYRTTSTDESGQFKIERVPPGSYSVYAWEDIEDGLWRDAEFLRKHAGSGRSLHVVESRQETVEIVVIPSGF
jgi:hypothetical protein